jgi:hypothetical protein
MSTYSLYSDEKAQAALTSIGAGGFGQQDSELLKQVLVSTVGSNAKGNLRTVSSTTGWVALPNLTASQVDILNTTGENLFIRYASETASGQQITLPDERSVALGVNSNSNEIQISATTGAAGVQLIVTP